jgi:hypothetical protein
MSDNTDALIGVIQYAIACPDHYGAQGVKDFLRNGVANIGIELAEFDISVTACADCGKRLPSDDMTLVSDDRVFVCNLCLTLVRGIVPEATR